MADKKGVGNELEHENSKFLLEERVICDGINCRIKLYGDCIEFVSQKEDDTTTEKLSWGDVLKVHDGAESEDDGSFVIHYIKNLGHVPPDQKGIRWKHVEKMIRSEEGREHVTQKLRENMQELLSQKVRGRPSSLLILINPRSGNFKAESIYNSSVAPLMKLMGISVDRVVLEGSEQTRKLINEYDLTKIDGIIAMGGDGTLADIINTVVLRHQREAGNDVNNPDVKIQPISIKLGIIPAGSGQGDTLILNGSFDAETAALHIIKGVTLKGDIYSCHNGDKWVSCGMLGAGLGYLADLIVYSESKRWLGTWRYFVAFLQALWYLQTFDAEVEILKMNESGEEEWEKLSGQFMEIDVSPGPVGHGTFFPGFLEVIVQREASRRDTMKYAGTLVKADPALYDFPHVTAFKAKQIKITLPNIEDKSDRRTDEAKNKVDITLPGSVVHLDGELFQITHPTITFRLHRHVLNFFGILRDADVICHR